MSSNTPRGSRRGARRVAAVAAILLGGAALGSSQSASATTIIIPAGCGSWSGLAVPLGWDYEDHSGDSGPVNETLSSSNEVFYIATPFDDYVQGGTTENVICGLGGDDELLGGDDVDELYGGSGEDTLSGQTAGDFLSGGPRHDILYGDDEAGVDIFDTGDELQGGDGPDDLYGQGGSDVIKGGGGSADWVDGEPADVCTGVEFNAATCL